MCENLLPVISHDAFGPLVCSEAVVCAASCSPDACRPELGVKVRQKGSEPLTKADHQNILVRPCEVLLGPPDGAVINGVSCL